MDDLTTATDEPAVAPTSVPAPTPASGPQHPAGDRVDDSAVDELVLEELLVEEISIDGMCGVY